MVTDQQRRLLVFIKRATEDRHGTPPSYREMMRGIGLASTHGVTRLLNGLEERGYIRRLPNRARAIEIIRMP